MIVKSGNSAVWPRTEDIPCCFHMAQLALTAPATGLRLAQFDKLRHTHFKQRQIRYVIHHRLTDQYPDIRERIDAGRTLGRTPRHCQRTAQRLIAKLIEKGQVAVLGEGRSRRYFHADTQSGSGALAIGADGFPPFIPLSADSQDILAYIDRPPEAHNPIGYQRDFLKACHPNTT